MKIIVSTDGTRLLAVPSNSRENTLAENHFAPYVKNYKNNPRFKMGLWDGKKRYWNNGKLQIGLWRELFNLCKDNDFNVEFEGKENWPLIKDVNKTEMFTFLDNFFKNHTVSDGSPFIPYEHQKEAVFNMFKKRYSTIEVSTGGGKSLILFMLLIWIWKQKKDMRCLLITPSKFLTSQYTNDLKTYYYGENKIHDHIESIIIQYNDGTILTKNPYEKIGDKFAFEIKEEDDITIKKIIMKNKSSYYKDDCEFNIKISEIMSDKPVLYEGGIDESNVVIGTFQSLSKKPKEFFENFDIIVTDEAHTAVNESLRYILESCRKSFWRCGMSGTYPDGSAEWMQVFALLGPIEYSIGAKQLQDLKVIAPIKIKIVELLHNDNQMGETLNNIKKRGGGKQSFELEKKYIHASQKRNDFLVDLVSKSKRTTLVLFHTTEWGSMFYDKCRTEVPNKAFYYIDGSIDNKRREYIKKQMEDDTSDVPRVLIASYGTLSTGVSIKKISRIIFADSFKDQKLIRQSIGRGLRLHKDKSELLLFDIVDNISNNYRKSTFLKHGKEREEIYFSQGWTWETMKLEI